MLWRITCGEAEEGDRVRDYLLNVINSHNYRLHIII